MTVPTPLMQGKKGLVMGIANDRSRRGASRRRSATRGPRSRRLPGRGAPQARVKPLADQLGLELVLPADVTDPASLDALFTEIEARWGRLDFLIHAIAFSDKEELKGRYINTSLANFERTMLISCFSFTDLARRAEPLMAGAALDADLHRRGTGHAALQRHGRRRRRSRPRSATSRSTWAGATCA